MAASFLEPRRNTDRHAGGMTQRLRGESLHRPAGFRPLRSQDHGPIPRTDGLGGFDNRAFATQTD
jgi:hypothetical protein